MAKKAKYEATNTLHKIVIGIDQSYKDTGISIYVDGKLKNAIECKTINLKNNCEKRKALTETLYNVFSKCNKKKNKFYAKDESCEVICIIERIRLHSNSNKNDFINIDYIKSIGALNSRIVDTASYFNIPVYSVDTRCWKSAVIGTSKEKANKYGIDPKKLPTILWCIKKGYKKYIINYDVGKKKKGVISKNGKSYFYNDNIADSVAIGAYYFNGKLDKLEKEN